MKLSQLTRRMDRGDEICVCLFGMPSNQNVAYEGPVNGIRKSDPLNGMFVEHVVASEDILIVEVKDPARRLGEDAK